MRTHLSKGLGFSKEDRDTNIERIGWVASRITRQGGAVIAAAISPYEETRQKARALVEEFGPFVEVSCSASVDECARRDVNGLYAKAFAGEIKGFTGVDDPYEAPAKPEIVVDTESTEPEEAAAQVIAKLEELGHIPAEVSRVTVAATDRLIAPHGGTLVDRTGERPDDLDSLETVQLASRELSDLDMLASGALSPLEGFMGRRPTTTSSSRACTSPTACPGRFPSALPWTRRRPVIAWPCSTSRASRSRCSRSRRSSSTTGSARPRTASARPTRPIPASRGCTGRSRSISPGA